MAMLNNQMVTYLKSPQGEVTSSAPSCCNPPSAVASSFPRGWGDSSGRPDDVFSSKMML